MSDKSDSKTPPAIRKRFGQIRNKLLLLILPTALIPLIGVILFSPCNIEEFKEKFKFIVNKDYHNQRRSFINNYSRNNIMKDMAVDLLNIRY